MFGFSKPRRARPSPELTNTVAPTDLRGEKRQPIMIDAALEVGSRSIECRVVDAGANGLRVQVGGMLPDLCIGQQILIRPTDSEALVAVVRWVAAPNIGLQFATPVSLTSLVGSRAASRRLLSPRMGRASVSMPVEFIARSEPCSGRIVNISGSGAMMRTEAALNEGDAILLHGELVRPIGGYIRWRDTNQCGVMFNRLLPTDAARAISDKFDVSPIWVHEIAECHERRGAGEG